LSIKSTHFFFRFFRYFRWFEFSLCWSHRLFEAWLASDWFKVDLVGDVQAFLPALSQYNLIRFFLAQTYLIV